MKEITAAFFAHASNLTGASRSMIDLSNALKKHGVRPIVFIPEKGPIEEELERSGIKYYIIPYKQWVHSVRRKKTLKKRFNYFVKVCLNRSLYGKVLKIFKEENVKIVHSNSLIFGFGAQTAKAAGLPHIWHIREFMEEDHRITFFDKEKSLVLMNEAKYLIAISDVIANKFSKLTGRNVEKIYNGVPIDKYKIQNKKLFESSAVNIMIAGRITEPKGHKEAVEAVELLKDKYPNIHLKIIGEGTPDGFADRLKQYVNEKALSQWVEFVPFQSDMTQYRTECDIQLVCSWNEAFGRVTVEGMLANAVVIGADAGCTPYLIKDGKTGFLYECKNPESLAEKIEYVINNKDIARKVTRDAYNYAVENFDIERVAAQVWALYKNVI